MSDDNVIVGVCGADGLCPLCAGEDRTGTDGCGSYFQAATLVEPLAKPRRPVTAPSCPECKAMTGTRHLDGCSAQYREDHVGGDA
jgi:hypothetical protein